MLAKEAVAQSFVPGTHASTFGGNPLACSVGQVVLKTLVKKGMLNHCAKMGALLHEGLKTLKERFSFVRNVRGKGLIMGMELEQEGGKIVDECREEGLLINCTAGRVLRFLPPLIVTRDQVGRALAILEKVLRRQ
jgi:acetylornithine/succinyldiaminopimelate/putrescine aminotransferase